MRLRSANLRSSELVSLAISLERTRSNRGKEPTYVSTSLLQSRPLSIPGHPGTLKRGTALSILNHLEGDVEAFDSLLPDEPDANDADTSETT